MSRYIRAEYEAVGLEPNDCGPCGTPYGTGSEAYWFACPFHDGYIEGFTDALLAHDVTGMGRALENGECHFCGGWNECCRDRRV